MSNRTIVEFNHDFAGTIDKQRFEFCEALGSALRSDDSEAWDRLKAFGVERLASAHHSDDRAVFINEIKAEKAE